MGPWDRFFLLIYLSEHFRRVSHSEPFIPGVPEKPIAGTFYPQNMSKEDFENWIKSLPEEEKRKATGFFHRIRQKEGQEKEFVCIPYSEMYKEKLQPAAKLLEEAAKTVSNESLRNFLMKVRNFNLNSNSIRNSFCVEGGGIFVQ